MAIASIPVKLKLNIPTTASAWDLYTHSMDCTEAANALTAALKVAIADVAENGTPTHRAMKAHMYPVMDQYADFGASDTEPRVAAECVLESVQALIASR
jgi:hypothetical protein